MKRDLSPKTLRRVPRASFRLRCARSSWVTGIFLIAGCGNPGAPSPPSLNLPAPVVDLSATRVQTAVALAWTMPARTTDHLLLKHALKVEICRSVESSPCVPLATVILPPGKPGKYADMLSGDLAQGSNRLLTYQIYVRNHRGKSAGASNSAFTASGSAPATLTGLTAQVRADGVLLGWHSAVQAPTPAGNPAPHSTTPAGTTKVSIVFHIDRVLLSPPQPEKTLEKTTERTTEKKTPKPAGSAKAPSAETSRLQSSATPIVPAAPIVPINQTLIVRTPESLDPGHALDASAQPNQQYRYTVRRIAEITLSGHTVELAGQPSDPLVVRTTDVFPPAVPRDLGAVADTAEGAIDLSWTPDTESDLAGYYVYRRELGSSPAARRISPLGAPVPAPAYRDTGIRSGHTYAYSVSAVDQSGNESARSPEALEAYGGR